MPSASGSSVAVSVSSSQLIKLTKYVTSLVLKKRKVTAIVFVFLRKAPIKKSQGSPLGLKEFFLASKCQQNQRGRLLREIAQYRKPEGRTIWNIFSFVGDVKRTII